MLARLKTVKAKPVLAALLVLAAGILLIRGFRRGGALPGEVNFVCAATGKTFQIDRQAVTTIPARNPKTGEATLMPCVSRDGVLYVSARYREELLKLGEKNRHVDPDTLAVRSRP